ncbi:Tim44 domain-containing protein [Desulforhopalus singaporensis]|uniref:Predicted lipid-binding transport protein, Tim44 family n=1 Tax=Desulforhopalus singaporensis TaxID=91360 RepID=A0A1H0UHQ9_9BACT|nr:Tim44 domain-containing protein [Desulforhopalus singaporensis]SDP65709.1 Predicted lipid-binding transport protein, Tim44 family [Desulforhopalus singaporensis]
MKTFCRTLAPVLLVLLAFSLIEAGITAQYADARSKLGGRTFKTTKTYKSSPSVSPQPSGVKQKSGFGSGLMGGLLGGALGGMLFGSMFGMGGSGMGILPLLLLGGIAYFLFRRFSSVTRGRPGPGSYPGYGNQAKQQPFGSFDSPEGGGNQGASFTPDIGTSLLEEGLAQIQRTDKKFDPNYFKEVASDVFFQVQAGWMRRDVDSYRHLLGEQLAKEYEDHFAGMRAKGVINKLESIAIRSVEVVEAGSDGREDFVTVRFTANLLDYYVDDKTGELVEGSMTDPVKFEEDWTWARPVSTQDWKLEGIK